MRKAYTNSYIIEDNGIFYGISLGYDYCAEHEWGIKGLISRFGINSSKLGVDGRTITKDVTQLVIEDKHALLITTREWGEPKETLKELMPRDFFPNKNPDNVQTAWDEGSFGVLLYGDENIKRLKELKEAFEKNDIAIAFMKGAKLNPFENASLSLVIKSRLPEDITKQMYNVDKAAFDLVEYEKEIGVAKLKETKRGGYGKEKYFMACSPRWIDYDDPVAREAKKKQLGTQYDIQFWVNYSDNDNNFGWYTAEDIIKWLSTPGVTLKSLNKKK